MKQSDNPIRKNLEEVFQELLSDENAPTELKDQVFQTLDTLDIAEDLVDLSTDNNSSSETEE